MNSVIGLWRAGLPIPNPALKIAESGFLVI